MNREPYSFFLAGTMQGSRSGDAELDQSYRAVLRDVILAVYADARVVCPRELLHQQLADDHLAIRRDHDTLANLPELRTAELSFPLQRLRHAFYEITDLASTVDVLVAWLPEHEASMGTAAEMWSATKGGATVITISPMRQNLAVLSTSDAIVPSVDAFRALLVSSWLDDTRRRSASARALRGRAPGEHILAPGGRFRSRRNQTESN
jgi:hypothetical protein